MVSSLEPAQRLTRSLASKLYLHQICYCTNLLNKHYIIFSFTSCMCMCVEGAFNVGGRLPSLWDTFVHEQPEKIKDRKTGDVGCDQYHRYKDDVKLLKDAGLDAFRFSISWPRILPRIKYFVTLFHWDVPQELETKYKGFLDSRMVEDFKDYCEVCFHEFGGRVKLWATLNKPYNFSVLGYDIGELAPARNRQIGIPLPSHWMKPVTNSIENIQARERGLEFILGWFMEPLVHGDYPFIMKALVRDRLPPFTKEESKMVKGSYDFIGINYYTARFASNVPISSNDKPTSVDSDSHVELKDKTIYICPEGIRDLLLYIKNKYNDPSSWLSGISQDEDGKLTIQEGLNDEERIKYHTLHLIKLEEAIRLGVKVKGYFTWSILDNFEWSNGYTTRFGLIYVDFKNGLQRYPKASLKWFNEFLKS
ncbi:putative glycosidase [Dioscorea sansibarensis]